jgi:hypothetical protein
MERTERMLRWLYTGRLIVATAIFIAALWRWLGPARAAGDADRDGGAAVGAGGDGGGPLVGRELRAPPPGANFLYASSCSMCCWSRRSCT